MQTLYIYIYIYVHTYISIFIYPLLSVCLSIDRSTCIHIINLCTHYRAQSTNHESGIPGALFTQVLRFTVVSHLE